VAFTCEPEEQILPYVLETIGATQVLYASDYAHWDCEFPESVHKVDEVLSGHETEKKLVLGGNAIRWFGLQADALPSESVFLNQQVKA
jgi:predicted TIM-barrel fold metal-dependent hydrolase